MFLDTNIIVYLATTNDAKFARSAELLERGATVSVQVLNEFVRATFGKKRLPYSAVEATLDAVKAGCIVVPLTLDTHELALTFADRHKINIYDANIIASALLAGCKTLFTEDLQDGQVIDGLTIKNPYAG